jgi:hypothetical protein
VPDDGDASGTIGDRPCGPPDVDRDANCPFVSKFDQSDSDRKGMETGSARIKMEPDPS